MKAAAGKAAGDDKKLQNAAAKSQTWASEAAQGPSATRGPLNKWRKVNFLWFGVYFVHKLSIIRYIPYLNILKYNFF